ncbi:TolC family protein [Clostridium sp. AM58-1XD]|uniref:TolC family protein n=1 Tax=Clostridium sp. AM58-1XD TaxID=2292307 RepID=UPI000E478C6C|nr:TolC family protein [Clostridium sp. AM58-1XD]RGY99303.1 TolC family protein [Clostridium sp. AM58-1XD]
MVKRSRNRLISLGIAAAMAAVPSMQVFASPEFAHTAEEWARLRDDVMEYGELADLIHEYNTTVYKNQVAYDDARDQDFNDAKDALASQANDLFSQSDSMYPEDTYAMAPGGIYANMIYGSAMMEYYAKAALQTSESSLVDNTMLRIRYDQQEAGLVMQAQILMNSYEQLEKNMALLEDTKGLLEAVYQSTLIQRDHGLVTQADVLKAQENISNLDANIQTAEKSRDQVKRNLCLLTGWSVNANPDIRPIPEVDMTRIDRMNPAADTATALANNYDLRYYTKQLENVGEESARKTAQANIDNTKETVTSQVKTLYETVLNKRTSYETAQMALTLEEVNKRDMDQKYQVGSASPLEYRQAQNTYLQKAVAVDTAKLDLFQAIENYEWALKGLVSGS